MYIRDVEISLLYLQAFKAHPFERCSLGVADARLHFPFAIGILDPARQGCDTVVSQNIAEQRVDRGIVEVGNRYAFFQVVENDESWTTAQATKFFLVQFRPSAYTRPPGEQAHAFAAIAERQHEQPRPAMLSALRITHHRTAAVVDLRFFSRCREDDACWFRTLCSAQLVNKALHRLIAAGKPVLRDQVLPNRLAIAAAV